MSNAEIIGHTSELIHEAAWRRGRETPDAVALYEDGGNRAATFGEVARESRLLARALHARGLLQGDVVSFQLPNWREAAAINIAASALGIVVNPIVPIYRGAECAHILNDTKSKLLFIPSKFRNFDYPSMIGGLRHQLPHLKNVVVVRGDPDGGNRYGDFLLEGGGKEPDFSRITRNSPKLIMYTSGTTGPAKGVLHSHETLEASHANMGYWKITSKDVIFMPSPITHITGYSWALEMPFLTGVKAALMVNWDAATAIDYIEHVGATLTVGSTPFLQELVNEVERRGTPPRSLRMFACGGAPVYGDLVVRANDVLKGCRVHRMYGSTEAPGVTRGWMGAGEAKLAATTDGKIIGWEVECIGPDGARLTPGEEGEVIVRGPAMMMGYNDPAQTAASKTEDGFFLTGDIGRVTPEGALVITGRKKDLIIRGGENISAWEIETILQRHLAVDQVAVVAMPHERLGETVAAFIVPSDPANPPQAEDLTRFLRSEDLARQKTPERIEFVNELPRTSSGKIRKDQLRIAIATILESEKVLG